MNINIRATGTRPTMVKGDAIVDKVQKRVSLFTDSVYLDGTKQIKAESRDRLVEEAAARLGIKFITNLVKDDVTVTDALDPDVIFEATNLKN